MKPILTAITPPFCAHQGLSQYMTIGAGSLVVSAHHWHIDFVLLEIVTGIGSDSGTITDKRCGSESINGLFFFYAVAPVRLSPIIQLNFITLQVLVLGGRYKPREQSSWNQTSQHRSKKLILTLHQTFPVSISQLPHFPKQKRIGTLRHRRIAHDSRGV
ncbi:hypothetical protein BGW80DRAFT_295378 [Lactifluus volemus]|nr:hypothetical protein BGW80DRAFT_295378 [Lactifluus volemus]